MHKNYKNLIKFGELVSERHKNVKIYAVNPFGLSGVFNDYKQNQQYEQEHNALL